jgi:acetoin:2,6-dichlorophenolindophenol oxidoreductase subunit alpha
LAIAIRLPDMGTNVEECRVQAWRVQVGESVKRGTVIADIETDKAVAELESTAEGVILQHVIPAGEVVSKGEILAYVGAAGEAVPAGNAQPSKPAAAEAPAKASTPPPAPAAPHATAEAPRVSPVVRNLAAKLGVDLSKVQGSGAGGTIKRDDVERAAKSVQTAPKKVDSTSPEFLLSLYRQMVLIRQFEERVKFLFLEGIMPGTIHQYNGEEAIAVGMCSALQDGDIITSTHRPHGHALARGLSAESVLHELFGRITGCCHGKGGSMHLGDVSKGMIPAIAIVGSGAPIATGAALAFKMKREPHVAVCFMGDGAVNEGAFHEGVNMGAVWSLPVVYVIENNLYSASTPIFKMVKVKKLSERAAAYGIPGVTIDGNDVMKVYETAREAIDRARAGGGPTLIEAMTYRITGHSRRDPCNYQPEDERKQSLENEPIRRFAAYLKAKGIATDGSLAAIDQDVSAEIERAVESAKSGRDPAPEQALEDMFV